VAVAVTCESQQPFGYVYDIKRNEQQFALLQRMYAFMVHDMDVYPSGVSREQQSEQVDTYILGN